MALVPSSSRGSAFTGGALTTGTSITAAGGVTPPLTIKNTSAGGNDALEVRNEVNRLIFDVATGEAATADEIDCNAPTAIHITHSDVTLDLGGRIIQGTDASLSEGITVDSGLSDVVVMNGTIADYGVGVGIDGAGSVAKGLVVRSNNVGIGAGEGATVRGNTIVDNVTGVSANGGRLPADSAISRDLSLSFACSPLS